jgi:hypothetical protein
MIAITNEAARPFRNANTYAHYERHEVRLWHINA